MTQEQLIAYYEKQLEKVIAQWGGDTTDMLGNSSNEYIAFAQANLEAVKNGRNW